MVKTVAERVRKFRAKKKSTERGREEMVALNRVYKKRHACKKEIAHLTQRRSAIAAYLANWEVMNVIASSRARRAEKLEEQFKGRDLRWMTVDERQELDLDSLKYEVKEMQARATEKMAIGVKQHIHGRKAGCIDGSSIDAPRDAMTGRAGGPAKLSTPSVPSMTSAGSTSKADDSAGQQDVLVRQDNKQIVCGIGGRVPEYQHAAEEG